MMRICSLLPGATEIVFALGLGDNLVGVTHECDFPPEAKDKPVLVRSAVDSGALASAEIDLQVGNLLNSGKSLYTLDIERLRAVQPDIIITQGLCDVCALDYDDVVRAARGLPREPEIVSLNPHSLTDVLDDISRVGAAAQQTTRAQLLVTQIKHRIEAVRLRAAQALSRPRTLCLEWFSPLYAAGHWLPEMVEIAGGLAVLAENERPSHKIEWSQVCNIDPELILLMPCGFDVERANFESAILKNFSGWSDLAAIKAGNVYAVDSSAYFSRPGPRLVDGLELLANIIHPELFPLPLSLGTAKRVNL
jgi:iron complex transport system substrate-binding protein